MDCDVIVVGSGVAGLATTLSLSQIGLSVRLCERATAPRDQGGALLLWSNATRVLERLGLADAVARYGTILKHTEFRDWRGNTLWTLPVDDLGREHGAPSIVIPRSDFIRVLFEALSAEVHFGWRFTHFVEERLGVAVHNDEGETLRAGALVGADGIHSLVRAQLMGESAPSQTGQIAWIGLSDFEHDRIPPGVAIATVGAGLRFWCAGLEGGRVYWYGIVKREHDVVDVGQLLELFSGAHEPIPDIIRATPIQTVVATPIQDRPPTPGWSQGRVTLLGDAAHPSTPDLGQGACQALESAATLASCCSASRSLIDAFQNYERRRFERAAAVSALARAVAQSSNLEHPVALRARDLAIQTQLPWASQGIFDWLLGEGA